MKRLLFSLFLLCLSLSVSCGGGDTPPTEDQQSQPMDVKGGEDFIPPGQLDPGGDFTGELAPLTGAELSLVVHLDKEETVYRNLQGVNRPPRFSEKAPGTKVYDAWNLYQAFGIRQVRLHDSKLDVCEVYQDDNLVDATTTPPTPLTDCTNASAEGPPHVVWAVNDPANLDALENYDFENGVKPILDAVTKSGAVPYIRLGESYNGPNDVAQPEAYAQVAAKIFEYIIGQLGTETPDGKPFYVEVFNEPDGMFWVGSNEAFYTLVRETIDKVKAVAAEQGAKIRIGSAGFVHGIVENLEKDGNVAQGFLDAVGPDRLDFFSAHYYGTCQTEKLENGWLWLSGLREKLNERELQSLPIHVTEWNVSLGSQCPKEYFGAQEMQSFVSGMLTMMQDHFLNVEAAHFYSGLPVMSLFEVDEQDRFIVRPSAWAFWAHSLLQDGKLLRAEVCGTDSCSPAATTTNFNVMGVSVRKEQEVFVLLTNITATEKDMIVRFKGLDLDGAIVETHRPPESEEAANPLDSNMEGDALQPVSGAVQDLMNAVRVDEVSLQPAADYSDAIVTLPGHSVTLLKLTLP